MPYKSPFYSTSGVVASEHPIASLIGARVLEEGNSVDAAIATSLALAVTLPHLGGLGGDYFALLRSPDGRVYFVDGSGYAPKRLTREFLLEKGYSSMPSHGPLSINVPGMVDALYLMWRKWGSIEWRKLVGYAAKIADKGFAVTRGLASFLEKLYGELSRDPGSRETYYSRGVLGEGELISFKGLAKALYLIGEDPRSFYEGEIARRITEYVESLGGVLSLEDMKNYKASLGDPLSITYRDRIIYEMPPPTQGITTLHLLKLVEEQDPQSTGIKSVERIRLLLEAAHIAYYIRDNYVTDPKHMETPVNRLLEREFLQEVWRKLQEEGISGKSYEASGDTTFYAIAGRDEWVIAGIQSLFYPFGSYVTEPIFNITLNSRASSFSLREDHVNRLEPWKKTMHTLSAIIMEDRERVLAIGLSGGHYRPLLHAQLVTNIVDYGLSPQEAIEYPRFIWHPWTRRIEYERGLDLRGLGNYETVEKPYPSRLGVTAIAEVKSKVKAGFTDIRGDGIPIGLP